MTTHGLLGDRTTDYEEDEADTTILYDPKKDSANPDWRKADITNSESEEKPSIVILNQQYRRDLLANQDKVDEVRNRFPKFPYAPRNFWDNYFDDNDQMARTKPVPWHQGQKIEGSFQALPKGKGGEERRHIVNEACRIQSSDRFHEFVSEFNGDKKGGLSKDPWKWPFIDWSATKWKDVTLNNYQTLLPETFYPNDIGRAHLIILGLNLLDLGYMCPADFRGDGEIRMTTKNRGRPAISAEGRLLCANIKRNGEVAFTHYFRGDRDPISRWDLVDIKVISYSAGNVAILDDVRPAETLTEEDPIAEVELRDNQIFKEPEYPRQEAEKDSDSEVSALDDTQGMIVMHDDMMVPGQKTPEMFIPANRKSTKTSISATQKATKTTDSAAQKIVAKPVSAAKNSTKKPQVSQHANLKEKLGPKPKSRLIDKPTVSSSTVDNRVIQTPPTKKRKRTFWTQDPFASSSTCRSSSQADISEKAELWRSLNRCKQEGDQLNQAACQNLVVAYDYKHRIESFKNRVKKNCSPEMFEALRELDSDEEDSNTDKLAEGRTSSKRAGAFFESALLEVIEKHNPKGPSPSQLLEQGQWVDLKCDGTLTSARRAEALDQISGKILEMGIETARKRAWEPED